MVQTACCGKRRVPQQYNADCGTDGKLSKWYYRRMGVSPEKAVMVGDTRFDCEGALLAQVDFIGALYGYGGEEELRKAGAKKLAADPEEIGKFLFL